MPRRRIIRIILGLTAPALLAVAIALVLMQWHQPTRVELAVTVDRVALTVAPATVGEVPATLINYGGTRAVRVERVARVAFEPGTLAIAEETRFDLKANRFPEDAWQSVAVTGDVVLEPVPGLPGVTPAVTLQSADTAAPGRIKSVRGDAGAQVVMEVGREEAGNRAWLTLAVDATSASIDLVFPARFFLFADDMRLTGTQGQRADADTLSLRARSDTNTAVRVQGSRRGLVLQLEPAGSETALLGEIQIPVSAVEFTRQGPGGERRSSLVASGTLRYPDLPAKGPVRLGAGEFVILEGLEKARIESLGLSSQGKRAGLKLILDAVASTLRIGTPEQPHDARLTWFDWLWYQPVLGILFAVIVWIFPTTVAGYKLWNELRTRSA